MKIEHTALQQRQGYHEGFYDAQFGEPLFDDATDDYKAGWRAFWSCADIEAAIGEGE